MRIHIRFMPDVLYLSNFYVFEI